MNLNVSHVRKYTKSGKVCQKHPPPPALPAGGRLRKSSQKALSTSRVAAGSPTATVTNPLARPAAVSLLQLNRTAPRPRPAPRPKNLATPADPVKIPHIICRQPLLQLWPLHRHNCRICNRFLRHVHMRPSPWHVLPWH